MLEQLSVLGAGMMETVLDGLDPKTVERMLRDLEIGEGQSPQRHQPQFRATASRQWLNVMSDKALKIVPAPEAKKTAEADRKKGLVGRLGRKRLRFLLLVAAPALAVLIGLGVYLSGGRYVSTDNAAIGAQKILVTPDISGKVETIAVREGQHVNAGDELFALDPQPFKLALAQAQAKLDTVRTDYNNLKSNLASLTALTDLAQRTSSSSSATSIARPSWWRRSPGRRPTSTPRPPRW